MDLLIPLSVAKKHLRITSDHADEDLRLKLMQAQAIVLDYVTQRVSDGDVWAAEVAAWTEETVPLPVQAAILLQFGDLYRFRGDDDMADQTKREYGYLAMGVTALLHRYRDPALA